MDTKPLPEDAAHRRWSAAVKRRDGSRCQGCDATGVRLEAHHLTPWRERPELVFDIDNGLTLCSACHHAAHMEAGDTESRKRRDRRLCPICGTAFVVYPSSGRLTCSRACGIESSRRVQQQRVAVTCGRCGAAMLRPSSAIGARVFCNTACRRQIERRPCEVCGTTFKPKAQQVHRGQGRFCSRACLGIASRGGGNPNYRHGGRVKRVQHESSV
jgi:5-methylcytosine-specific restriction endonuclease McrA